MSRPVAAVVAPHVAPHVAPSRISFSVLFSVLALALLSGCAAPGEPTPRHPEKPVAVVDLSAHQSGNAVVLTFGLPNQSTDRKPLSEAPSIEIYRATLAQGALPGAKTPWRLVYTIPSGRVDAYAKAGRVDFRDTLAPEDLGRSDGSGLAYMVRTGESKKGLSDDSNLIELFVHPAPAIPADLRIAVSKSALTLSWTETAPPGTPAPTGFRIFRAEAESSEQTGTQAGTQDLSQVKLKSALDQIGFTTLPEFRDTGFEFGKTYVYLIRAVAQFGAVVVDSADSAPAFVTPRNTFPPGTPTGLETLVIPATPGTPAYVELSWGISPEEDLAGYNVYRSDREDTPGERINREILLTPTFRDTSVAAGARYFYRVSVVDQAGNESPLSSAAPAEVPKSEP